MTANRKRLISPCIGGVTLGLICLAVGVASYIIGHYVTLEHVERAVDIQQAASSVPPVKPAPSQPSPARVTVLPKKPANQTSPGDRNEAQAETEAEPAGAAYVIQVASFESQERADDLARKLAEGGYPAQVTKSGSEDRPTYAVITGQHKDESTASDALSALKKDYPDAFIKRLKVPER